jgi:diguanylate cyclase (GGDEF)-like protein
MPGAPWIGRLTRAKRDAVDAGPDAQARQAEAAERARADLELRARVALQSAAVEVAHHALARRPRNVLIQEILGSVGRTLRVEAAALWETEPGAPSTLVAQQGKPELVAGLAAVASYGAGIGEAVAVGDLTQDLRFRGIDGLEPGAVSALTAPVSFEGRTIGVLGVASSSERAFTADEVAFLRGTGQSLGAAMARGDADDALKQQALTDPLTGLANRSLFHDRLQQALRVAARERHVMAVMLIDLDHFKEVNDTLGHHWGDVLLNEVSSRLRAAVRPSDTVARLGGDEFAVILPAATDLASVSRLAGKLLAAIEQPITLDGQPADVRGSIGVALYPEHGEEAETLLRRADVAMYAAKQAGGGFGLYAPEDDEHDAAQLALAADLRRALERDGELELRFQPQIDLRQHRPCGLEAQLRWQHPVRGPLEPDQFMPLAERTGLIKAIDRFALRAAVRACETWRAAGWQLPVSVKMSPRSLLDQSLPDFVADVCQQRGVPASEVTLELSESTLMADPRNSTAVLLRLRALGVEVAIAAFGTGYSCLGALKRLPVNTLKIDKSFVGDVATDKGDLAIVRSIVELGHSFGLRVVAEGVDNPAALRLLGQLGCDQVQGPHLSDTLSESDALLWLGVSRTVSGSAPAAGIAGLSQQAA